MPRAPDPEEIVFEGESAKENDNFDQNENESMDVEENLDDNAIREEPSDNVVEDTKESDLGLPEM